MTDQLYSIINPILAFLSDPGIPGPIYGSKPLSVTPRPCADLTDVTLADEDTNSILDNANRAIQGNEAMQVPQPGGKLIQVVPSGGQICNQCMWRYLVAQFKTNSSGAIWWPKVEPIPIALDIG